MCRQAGRYVNVQSPSVGNARRGQERFIATRFREYCENFGFGICSTWWKTTPTYRGHGHRTFLDTWTIPLGHIREVQTYKCMPRIAAQFRSVGAIHTEDHVPIMVFLFHHLVATQKRFRWDKDALVQAMNDPLSSKRREFLTAVKDDLEENKGTWREMWTETTCDPMWNLLNERIVLRHARMFSNIVNIVMRFMRQLKKRETCSSTKSFICWNNYTLWNLEFQRFDPTQLKVGHIVFCAHR
jgi:hypothetical protein